ncbi:SIR2 family protein [Aliarcobacter butzleri]|uniref:SIR2 family protein n=1 Tax=Aliarcobacter butzleri TaxID=28197 RepID=UPI001EDBAB83|nr:SIR2 family protein [Aliarcobacter butzleri]MCG3657189.1 SIR2 family protein [Aliarcobacter butzleri]MDK2051885.1 SIR2 family protein [Aliarcobacter butzleri]
MDDKIFLSTKNKFIEIKEDELKINGNIFKEKVGDTTVEYKLSPDGINEATLTKKALELSQDYYIKSLEKLVSAEKLLVLTGAGSSKNDELFGGKLMWELWKIISELEVEGFNFVTFLDTLEITQDIRDKFDLEIVLSKAKLYLEFRPDDSLSNHVKTIEETILKECSFSLKDKSIHLDFIKKLTSRKSKQSRLKIFTTNYDKAFEEAGAEGGYVIIDGFSFTQPRKFSGKYFDYDIVIRENSRTSSTENFANNVFHLYKLHGSVNWEKRANDIIQIDSPSKAMMIYPNSNKYESSYEQPYFEMMSRFQSELRKNGTSTLICIGFSFADKHIFTMINEALNQNPSLNLVIIEPFINPTVNENFEKLFELSKRSSQVIIIGEYFKDFVSNLPFSQYLNSNGEN